MSMPTGTLVFALAVCVGGFAVAQKFADRQATASTQQALAMAPPPPVMPGQRDDGDEPTLSGVIKINSRGGQFSLDGRIGTRTTPFIVDTGASVVALTWETGTNLGLVSIGDRMDAQMSTANGTVSGKFVTISRIESGKLRVDNIRAVVMPKGALSQNLLGMSFLNRLKSYTVANGVMTLTQ